MDAWEGDYKLFILRGAGSRLLLSPDFPVQPTGPISALALSLLGLWCPLSFVSLGIWVWLSQQSRRSHPGSNRDFLEEVAFGKALLQE